MKRFLLAATAVACLMAVAPANAADLPTLTPGPIVTKNKGTDIETTSQNFTVTNNTTHRFLMVIADCQFLRNRVVVDAIESVVANGINVRNSDLAPAETRTGGVFTVKPNVDTITCTVKAF